MAIRLSDGSIQMRDGRIIYANSVIIAADLIELMPLFTPPPAWPFVSGGGGGGSGSGGLGTPGARGADGAAGVQGNQGPSGAFGGPQGNQGNQGIAGVGSQGFQGFGFQGAQGNQGLSGAGVQGSQGNQGNQGFGFQGLQGNQGNQGDLGVQGFQGTNPGPQGNQGDLGPQGFQGAGGGSQGAQGFQGDTGPQGTGGGAQGFQGMVGPQGSGSGGGGAGIWELIETQTVPADTDTVDFLGLDGEFDGFYYLDYTIIKGVAGPVVADLQPNAIGTNQRTESLTFGTSVAPTQGSDATGMHIYGSGGQVGEAQRGRIEFWPKTGLPRSGLVGTLEASITFNTAYRIISTITWLEAVTAITSLRVKANVAGGIQAGSVLTLYKVSPSGSSSPSMADVLMQKSYFAENGLLPANTIQENINTLDALDFQNLAGGTLVQSKAQIKYTPSGLHSNFGWDLGAAYDRVLMIVGGIRARSFNMGPLLTPTLPVIPHPDDGYMALSEPITPAMKIYKNVAGPTEVQLATEPTIGMPDTVGAPFCMMALFVDGPNNVQRAFVRVGSGQWIEYAVTGDVDYISFQYAGFFVGNNASQAMWITGPVGIYAD